MILEIVVFAVCIIGLKLINLALERIETTIMMTIGGEYFSQYMNLKGS